MRLEYIIMSFFLILVSCQSPGVRMSSSSSMGKLEAEFFDDLFKLHPNWGSSLGKREYDAELPALDKTFRDRQMAFGEKYAARLKELPLASLSEADKVDYRLLTNFIEKMKWEITEFKSFEWDASNYNVGGSIATLFESKMSDSDRQKSLLARLQKTPAYYEAALVNLRHPTKEHLKLALQQNRGTKTYFDSTVKPFVIQSQNASLIAAFEAAQKSVDVFIEKITKLDVALQKSNGYRSFRLGPALYKKKFAFDLQIPSSAETIYVAAIKEKEKTLNEMAVVTGSLWKKYFPKEKKPRAKKEMIAKMVHRLAEEHATPEDFVDKVRAQLPELWNFVESKNLLALDKSKPLTVRLTPEYEQGFSIASVDSPGPFDPERETYYNVTPLNKMDAKRVESFLKEYNNYTMQILNIHEAIPGHYAQLVYSKKSPSLVKSILGNGAMVEGWAVYSERMMLENGYGNDQPELMLMYKKWYMRVVYNMILDYEIHNRNLSKKEALRNLTQDVFQEQTEAELKWDRATYSQVQLTTYFAGFTEIYNLREQLKKNKDFDLLQFHEKFLSFGNAPITEIKHLMLSEGVKNESL